ncbi:SDR family NAD(P)-dependent oxidoreductase [Puteibacter caeruleilacunae]|nr:SDR family NAD(P)-dependent oxidoreductase [Puteibacter caeruleilacunae]
MNKVALITGANQGLGFGLVQKVSEIYGEGDFIYLGVRRTEAGEEALKNIKNTKANLEVIYIDVSKEETIEEVKSTIVKKHGGIDLILSNAAARISPTVPNSDQVENFVQTNNMGTYYMLKHFQPTLKINGKIIVIASAFGSLLHLDANLHHLFNIDAMSCDEINKVMQEYVDDVKSETDESKGWPQWINIPSKIGQVALTKIAAKKETGAPIERNISVFAVCPGLVDTDASRPFFKNMHEAQSPYEAAQHIIALIDKSAEEVTGKLIQFGKELPWN